MVRKNWKEIALVGNEQLRKNLIAAEGNIAEGLAKGFPQYFLGEDEAHPTVARGDFVYLASEMKRREDVVEACKEAGIPFQRLSFSGHCRGEVEGVSYAKGGYDTVRNGYDQYFHRSSKKVGEEVEYEGATWVVVYNRATSGSAYGFATHTLIIVPATALAD